MLNMNDLSVVIVNVRKSYNLAEKWGFKPQDRTEMTMRLSYYGNRAGDDPTDKTRYAVASWKDGYPKDEGMSYSKSAVKYTMKCLNYRICRWAMSKYKRFRSHKLRALKWLCSLAKREPNMFAHWALG